MNDMSTGPDSTNIRLRLSSLFAVIALVAVFVFVLGQRWYVTIEEEAVDITEQARIIGANAAAALVLNDRLVASETLAALKNSTYVVEAALYRADGTQLANFQRRGSPMLPNELGASPIRAKSRSLTLRGMRISVAVGLNGSEVGTIVIRSSMERVYRKLAGFFEIFLLIIVVCIALVYFTNYRLRRRMRESRNELLASQYMIRQLSIHREQLVEEEHKRIAIEIHDDLGQILTTAMLHLKRLSRALRESHSSAVGQVEEIEGLVDDAFRSIKNIAMDLRPAVLNFGLTAALEWLTERTLGGSGIAFHLDVADPPPMLEERCSTTLFRIAQESLTNVVRHAQAKSVWIALKLDTEYVSLTIEDDGIGFGKGSGDGKPRFGLLGIRERAESLQGHAEINSTPNQGVCVVVTVPLSVALRQDGVRS